MKRSSSLNQQLYSSAMFLAGVMVVGLLSRFGAVAEASILIPDDTIDMEEVLALLDEGSLIDNEEVAKATSGADDVPAFPNMPPAPRHDDESGSRHLNQVFTNDTSGGSSSSSGTSSSGGVGGASSFAFVSGVLAISDAELTGSAFGEWLFSLPSPPGGKLLKVPRNV